MEKNSQSKPMACFELFQKLLEDLSSTQDIIQMTYLIDAFTRKLPEQFVKLDFDQFFSPNEIPPEAYMIQTVRHIIAFIKKFKEDGTSTIDLSEEYSLVRRGINLMLKLYHSREEVDRDVYYIVASRISGCIHNHQKFLNLTLMLDKLEKNEAIAMYLDVNSCPALKKVVEFIKTILTSAKKDFELRKYESEAYKTFKLCFLLNIRKNLTTKEFSKLVPEELEEHDMTMDHLLDLIPQKVLLLGRYVYSGQGITLYSGTVCISRRYFDPNSEEDSKNLAQGFVILMHELIHRKRMQYYSSNHYFVRTPESIFGEEFGHESRFQMEKYLFGSKLILGSLTEEQAQVILDSKSYETTEGRINLKKIFEPSMNVGDNKEEKDLRASSGRFDNADSRPWICGTGDETDVISKEITFESD